MRLYTEKNPKFSDSIKITDTTDPGNANLINEAAKQLIQNDLVIKKRIEQCLGEDPEHGNSQDMVVTFDSGDNTSAGEWTNVAAIQNGETHKSLFGKISTMFKNVRYLYKLLGTTDISSIGDGTVTNAIKKLKEDQPDAATQSVAGLLSADDKKKLDEIATKANNYTHPTTHAASMITQDTTHRFVSDTEKNAWDNKLNKTDVTRSTAVTVEGQKALDAVEKNAAVPGTMAYDLAQINSKLNTINNIPITLAVENIKNYGVSTANVHCMTYGHICLINFQFGLKSNLGAWEARKVATGVPIPRGSNIAYSCCPVISDGSGDVQVTVDYNGNLFANGQARSATVNWAMGTLVYYIP